MTAFHTPLTIFRRQSATDGTTAPANASGLTLGNNDGAVTASQEYYIFQNTVVAGNQPLYEVGVGGTGYISGAISIPGAGVANAQVIGTIPAGSRIQGANVNFLQAPTAVVGGSLTFSLNGTAIATASFSNAIGNVIVTFANTLAALRLIAYVGPSDAVLTVTLAGTGLTGGVLAEVSLVYTAKRGDGSILAQGGAADPGTE